MRITKLERVPEGHWRARVTVDGTTVAVDNRFGSWRITPPGEGGSYRELLPTLAARLQQKVCPLERKGRTA